MAKKPEQIIDNINKKLKEITDIALSKAFLEPIASDTAHQIKKRTRLGYGVKNGKQVRLNRLSKSYIEVRRGNLRFYTNKETKQIFTVDPGAKKKIKVKSKGFGGIRSIKAIKPAKKSKIFTDEISQSLASRQKNPIRKKRKKRKKPLSDRLKGLFARKKVKEKKRKKRAPKRLSNLSSNTSPGKSNLTATGQMLDSITSTARKAKIIIEIPDNKRSPGLLGESTDLTNADLARIHKKGAKVKHPSGTSINIPERNFFELTNAEKNKIKRRVREIILQLTRSQLT